VYYSLLTWLLPTLGLLTTYPSYFRLIDLLTTYFSYFLLIGMFFPPWLRNTRYGYSNTQYVGFSIYYDDEPRRCVQALLPLRFTHLLITTVHFGIFPRQLRMLHESCLSAWSDIYFTDVWFSYFHHVSPVYPSDNSVLSIFRVIIPPVLLLRYLFIMTLRILSRLYLNITIHFPWHFFFLDKTTLFLWLNRIMFCCCYQIFKCWHE
jgi:hypothetical protein